MNTYKILPKMNLIEALKNMWNRRIDFSSRSRRSEFWWSTFFLSVASCIGSLLLIFMVLAAVEVLFPSLSDNSMFGIILLVIIFVFACFNYFYLGEGIRRLHDIGRSGRWAVAQIIFSFLSVFVTFLWIWSFSFPELTERFDDFEDNLETLMGMKEVIIEIFTTQVGLFVLTSMLVFLILAVLSLIVLVFYLKDSQKETNRFGVSPEYYL